MFQPTVQTKCNGGFRNETQFYGPRAPFVRTPVRYKLEQSVQARPINYVGRVYQESSKAQQTTGFIRMPQARKFMPPLMQTSQSHTFHAPIENVKAERLMTAPAPHQNPITSNSKFTFKGDVKAEQWMTATGAACIQVNQTPIRGQFIQEPHHSRDGNDMMPQVPASPRPVLGASSIDNTMMSNLMIHQARKVSTTNMTFKLCGTSDREKMFIFTGTVEKAIKWNKIFCNHACYFEVIASVLSIEEGSVKSQMVMLLRDRKGGPILQMVYYTSTYLALQDFFIGQMLRCVGKMNGRNIFNAVSIRAASSEEVENLQRLCCVCDQAVSQHYLNV